jgi:hypothetical protein
MQLFYSEQRKIGEDNEMFMLLVNGSNGDPLKKEDLEKMIDRNPRVWSRYSGFLKTLPSRNPAMAS